MALVGPVGWRPGMKFCLIGRFAVILALLSTLGGRSPTLTHDGETCSAQCDSHHSPMQSPLLADGEDLDRSALVGTD